MSGCIKCESNNKKLVVTSIDGLCQQHRKEIHDKKICVRCEKKY